MKQKLRSFFRKIRSLFDAKMLRFLLVGILNTIVGEGIIFLLLNVMHVSYWPSTAIGYVLSSIMSYFLNRRFTFKYHGKDWRVPLRFALNIAVCYLLAYGIAQPLVSWILSGVTATARDNLAALAGMGLFVCFNYVGQRLFTFREESAEPKK